MSIDDLAHELIELRQAAKQFLDSGDIEAWLNAMPAEFRAAERLRFLLLTYPAVVTDDPAVKQLLAGFDLSELDNPTEAGMGLLSWSVSPAEYATNLAMVDVLVAPFHMPTGLQQFLSEARDCFAIGHSAAVQSLSRTILEAAVNDVAVRTGLLPREAAEQDMSREFPTWKRIQLVSDKHFDQVYQHYRNLCKVVHGLSTWAADGSLGSLTKTIGYVQLIYELNKEQIRKDRTN